jgi:hypothetical protein
LDASLLTCNEKMHGNIVHNMWWITDRSCRTHTEKYICIHTVSLNVIMNGVECRKDMIMNYEIVRQHVKHIYERGGIWKKWLYIVLIQLRVFNKDCRMDKSKTFKTSLKLEKQAVWHWWTGTQLDTKNCSF